MRLKYNHQKITMTLTQTIYIYIYIYMKWEYPIEDELGMVLFGDSYKILSKILWEKQWGIWNSLFSSMGGGV